MNFYAAKEQPNNNNNKGYKPENMFMTEYESGVKVMKGIKAYTKI